MNDFTLETARVCRMHVTVQHIFRLICFHKIVKTGESPVCNVFKITVAGGRSVCDKYIKTVFESYFSAEVRNAPLHFFFGGHIFGIVVSDGTAEPHDPETFIVIYFVVDTDAAERRMIVIFVIVVAVYIKQRAIGHGYQEFQVVRVEVAA